jgi:hypothetical protein
MCHSAERSLQKIDTHIARFPARSQSFSAPSGIVPFRRTEGDVKANRVDLHDRGSVPLRNRLEERRAICSDAASRELSAPVTCHHQLIEMMTAESNLKDRAPKTHIYQRVRALKAQLAAVDREIRKVISASEPWRRKTELLYSVPGVGCTRHLSPDLLSSLIKRRQDEGANACRVPTCS